MKKYYFHLLFALSLSLYSCAGFQIITIDPSGQSQDNRTPAPDNQKDTPSTDTSTTTTTNTNNQDSDGKLNTGDQNDNELYNQLSLSNQQRSQFDNIDKKYVTIINSIRRSNKSRVQKQSDLDKAKVDKETEIKSILSSSQYTKYRQIMYSKSGGI